MSEKILENVRERIEASVDKFMALYRQGDAAGIAELYTDDAIFMPPNMDFIHSKQAIKETIAGLMSMGVKALVFEVIEVDHCGDRAIEMSRYRMLGPEEQVLDSGKYIVVWKKEHDDWKMHRDIFNSSVPAKG